MHIERTNPEGIHAPAPVYSHLVTVTGGKTLYIAGQIAMDADGNLIGENDLAAQVAQVFENIKTILASAGADFTNVVRLTMYIVDYQYDDRDAVIGVLQQYLDPNHLPANTVLGIQSLARPGLRIEVDTIAVVE